MSIEQKGGQSSASEWKYGTIDGGTEVVSIVREPETQDEQTRVLQAQHLLLHGRLKNNEIEYWKGIVQNGGQENPPYKPQTQTQTQRQ